MRKSRSYIMLTRAPQMMTMEEESELPSEEEEEYIDIEGAEAEEATTDVDVDQSEQSTQLSYRPITPKAPPLPIGLKIRREPPMDEEDENEPETGRSGEKSSDGKLTPKTGGSTPRKVSGQNTPKDVTPKGSIKSGGTKQELSPLASPREQSVTKSPAPSKGSSRKTAGSNPASLPRSHHTSQELETVEHQSRPRSEHEDPVTQMEIEDETTHPDPNEVKSDRSGNDSIQEDVETSDHEELVKKPEEQDVSEAMEEKPLSKAASKESVNKSEKMSKAASVASVDKTGKLSKAGSKESVNKSEKMSKAPSKESVNKSEKISKAASKDSVAKSAGKGEATPASQPGSRRSSNASQRSRASPATQGQGQAQRRPSQGSQKSNT